MEKKIGKTVGFICSVNQMSGWPQQNIKLIPRQLCSHGEGVERDKWWLSSLMLKMKLEMSKQTSQTKKSLFRPVLFSLLFPNVPLTFLNRMQLFFSSIYWGTAGLNGPAIETVTLLSSPPRFLTILRCVCGATLSHMVIVVLMGTWNDKTNETLFSIHEESKQLVDI